MLVKQEDEIDSAEFATQLRGREPAAIQHMVAFFKQPLFAFVHGMLGHREDAEDVLQDVFLRAVRAIDKFDERRASLKTWLYTIARNCCLTVLSKRTKTNHESLESEPLASLPAPDQALHTEEQMQLLDAALGRLPEQQRIVFLLCEVQRLPLSEVAEITESPLGTVKSRLNRSKQHLRKLLGPPHE